MGADYKKQLKTIILWVAAVAEAAGQTRYWTADTLNAGIAGVEIPVPVACEAFNLWAFCNPAPGVGETITYTLMVNGVASALTVQIVGAAQNGQDLVNVIPLAAGDLICMRTVSSVAAAPSNVKCGFLLRPF